MLMKRQKKMVERSKNDIVKDIMQIFHTNCLLLILKKKDQAFGQYLKFSDEQF